MKHLCHCRKGYAIEDLTYLAVRHALSIRFLAVYP